MKSRLFLFLTILSCLSLAGNNTLEATSKPQLLHTRAATNPEMFVCQDPATKTYQLRIYQQPFVDDYACVFYTLRAMFCILYGTCDNTFNIQEWYYKQILDPAHSKMALHTIPYKDYLSYDEVSSNFLEEADGIATNCRYIFSPQTDKKLIDKICICYAFDPRQVLGPGHFPDKKTKELFKKRIDTLTKIIKTHENISHKTAQQHAMQAAVMYASQYDRLLGLVTEHRRLVNHSFGVLSSTKTGAVHALGLIANKRNGEQEFLFFEPLNVPLTLTKKGIKGRWAANYRSTVKTLRTFITNPVTLKNAIIRYLYAATVDGEKSPYQAKKEIRSLKLHTQSLYLTTYKNPLKAL